MTNTLIINFDYRFLKIHNYEIHSKIDNESIMFQHKYPEEAFIAIFSRILNNEPSYKQINSKIGIIFKTWFRLIQISTDKRLKVVNFFNLYLLNILSHERKQKPILYNELILIIPILLYEPKKHFQFVCFQYIFQNYPKKLSLEKETSKYFRNHALLGEIHRGF